MKRILLGTLAGAIAGLVIAVQVSGPITAQENKRLQTTYEQLDLFGDIFERIRQTYVDEVDDLDLILHIDKDSFYPGL